MIMVSGPYSVKNVDADVARQVKKARAAKIAEVCAKLINRTVAGEPIVAVSPLLSGLAIIEKGGMALPDTGEFWLEFCRCYVRSATTLMVINVEGWDTSDGVKDEINEAKLANIPVYLIDADTLEHITVL